MSIQLYTRSTIGLPTKSLGAKPKPGVPIFYGSSSMDTSNTAAWTITENSAQEIGFPSELTVATLLGQQGDQPFVLELVVTTVIRRGKDDSHHKIAFPIHFDP